MKILDRYIGWTIVSTTLTVLVVLAAIFTFFGFIDQLEDVGRGAYTVWKAAGFVALNTPGLTYQLFPMAALIGALLGFGTLMRNGEITVIRVAGVSKARVVGAVLKAGLVMLTVVFLVGELLAPPAERIARDLRNNALSEHVSFQSEHGFWSRDGLSYVNIRQILPGDQLREIYIYEFDDLNRLKASTYAESARYEGQDWVLKNISRTEIDDEGLRASHLAQAPWDSRLKPELLAMVTIEPASLDVLSLVSYMRFLARNGEDSERYEHALWTKLTYPLATVVMVLLAVPMVLRAERTVTVGQRVLVGALIGLGFHLLNQAAGHLGVVYAVPPFWSAAGPGLLMLAVAGVLLARTP
ncbi:MAG: LPS export ABC transporter permease LptG [Gammaproteobacteria bacterium]|nr:LPS export ABC transporter permease LptG [Gammaproteobacteria bacterium]